MKKIILCLLISFTASFVMAQSGLKVGDAAPAFTATDNAGNKLSLNKLLKENKYVVLFFYRGQWCPYCNKHISELQDSLQTLTSKGAYVVGVTPETNTAISKTVDKTGASFSMISDGGYAIMKDYKVDFMMEEDAVEKYKTYGVDLTKNNGNAEVRLPVPATYIIDHAGKIKFMHFDKDYKRRASVKTLAAAMN